MIVQRRRAFVLRLAGALCLAIALSGCVVVPYSPWHSHYGYYR